MREIEKIFQKTLSDQLTPKLVIEKLIIKKLRALGRKISDAEQAQIRTALANSSDGLMSINIDDGSPNQHETVNLDLDVTEAVQFREELIQEAAKIIPSIAKELAALLLKQIKRAAIEELQIRDVNRWVFEQNLRHYWGKALDQFSLFLELTLESGQAVNSMLRRSRPAKKNSFLIEVLTRLHARACQVYREIKTLLEAGLADGAFARWRTLHEIAVTSFFISEHGNKVAERYFHHEAVESWRAAMQFNEYAVNLGYAPFSQKKINTLEKQKTSLCQRFGNEFKNSYGWASTALNKANPTFLDIEKAAKLDHLRPYYKFASHNVHAAPKGMISRLGLLPEKRSILLAGPSNVGLDEPGCLATVSMCKITVCLLTIRPTLDGLVYLNMLSQLSREVENLLRRAQQRIKKEERDKSKKKKKLKVLSAPGKK